MSGWHGGVPGLREHDWLLPPDVSGTEHTLSQYMDGTQPHGTRTDVVYIARHRRVAEVFAAIYPDGALYEVDRCFGLVGLDPDAPELSLMYRKARIKRVAVDRVELASRPVEEWLDRLEKSGVVLL